MLISTNHRFIFVANSKSASTSIERLLMSSAEIHGGGNAEMKHQSISEIRKKYYFLFEHQKFPFESFYKFGVMRKPLDWISSWYAYRLNGNKRNKLKIGTTFQEFWEQKDWNFFVSKDMNKKRLQLHQFVDPHTGQCLMDKIIDFNFLDKEFDKVLSERGLGQLMGKLPKLNSFHDGVEIKISESLRKEIETFYEEDYEFFRKFASH